MRCILIVEDSPALRKVAVTCFASAGFAVESASHGKEALEIIRSRSTPFDAVLSDHDMPHMSGVMLARSIRAIDGYRNIPIMIMSASDDPKTRQIATRAGVTAWIVKDYGFTSALATLKETLSA